MNMVYSLRFEKHGEIEMPVCLKTCAEHCHSMDVLAVLQNQRRCKSGAETRQTDQAELAVSQPDSVADDGIKLTLHSRGRHESLMARKRLPLTLQH